MFDLVLVAATTCIGFLIRRRGLPSDGLWLDDAWVAVGAIHGRATQLIMVGSAHPGFTGLLMGWTRVSGGSLRSLALPALVAGVATPPILYLGLLRTGYERSVCALLTAALVVGVVHGQQSSRVKPYTLDTLVVLILAIGMPRLTRIVWGWTLAIAWLAAAVALGSVSGYTLVATVGAGGILVLHRRGDLFVRLIAVTVQVMLQAVFYLRARQATDLDGIEAYMENAFDGHMTFHLNPIDLGAELARHIGRAAAVYPGGSQGWATLFGCLALAGLVAASIDRTRRPEAQTARFLLGLVGFAVVGAFLGRFPFGPRVDNPASVASSGGRHSMWLIPAFAFGLAAFLHRAARRLSTRSVGAWTRDAVLVALAVVVVVNGFGRTNPYPQAGLASAAAYVESHIEPGDVVFLPDGAVYSFAASTNLALKLAPTPDHLIGFTPNFKDKRLRPTGEWARVPTTTAAIYAAVTRARRVLIYGALLTNVGAFGGRGFFQVLDTVRALRLHEETIAFNETAVVIWTR